MTTPVKAVSKRTPVMDKYGSMDSGAANHMGHAFPTWVLREIEDHLPEGMECSAETGCGKSTILISNYSKHHLVFAIDDRHGGSDSSVLFYERHPLTRPDTVRLLPGPSQATLPKFEFKEPLDLVLIDGGHGFPFPQLDYYFFYPHLRKGGLLIVDDVQIPSISYMADFLAEDEMFEFVAQISSTALFRRTNAAKFDPFGDGFWQQRYNRRRMSPNQDYFLDDGTPVIDKFSSQKLDLKLHGDKKS